MYLHSGDQSMIYGRQTYGTDDAIRVVLCDDQSSSNLIPSWQDCDLLLSITAALKPLKVMTDVLNQGHRKR